MTEISPTPPPKTRKPRQKKWSSELARQAHSNMRRKLARESAEREVETMKRAKQDLANAKNRLLNVERNKRANMVSNGLTPRLRAVMNSWGLNLKTQISASTNVSAWTDFSTISVSYDSRLTSRDEYDKDGRFTGNLAPISVETLREISAETRGLFYHEVGHNLFSESITALLTLAWEDGYVPDAGGAFMRNEPTPVAQRREETAHNSYPSWDISPTFQNAWNVLEDQRMECLLVEESPHIASYLTVLVLRRILGKAAQTGDGRTAWALVAGRKYLPRSVRDASKRRWYPNAGTDADTVANLIDAYAKATDAVTMIQIIEQFKEVIAGVNNPALVDVHHQIGAKGNAQAAPEGARQKVQQGGQAVQDADDKDTAPGAPSKGTADDEDDDAPGGAGDEEGEDEGTVGEGEGEGEDGDDSPAKGAGSGEHDPDDFGRPSKSFTDDARRECEEALQDLADDDTITGDVIAMNNAYAIDDGDLPTYGDRGTIEDDELVATAQMLVDDFVRAFEIATADCQPHWESGMRRGVLEPIRYRTRQPGDLEIFRQYADDGEPGHDISVSVFLDVSGSMSGSTDNLGAAAWATKVACERIGVECDVTLFDTGAWSLWGAHESPDHVQAINSHGGTDPRAAFDARLSEERDKAHHLVLVMTDGAWNGESQTALRDHRHPNMHTMIFNYESYYQKGMAPDPQTALRLSSDEAYTISDLMDIPKALESMLVSLA